MRGQRPAFCCFLLLIGRKSSLGDELFSFYLFSLFGDALALSGPHWRWGGFQGPSERVGSTHRAAAIVSPTLLPEIFSRDHWQIMPGHCWGKSDGQLAACAPHLHSPPSDALTRSCGRRKLCAFLENENISLLSTGGGWERRWSARFWEIFFQGRYFSLKGFGCSSYTCLKFGI